ncbi:MAG: hypothetical protein WC748_09770 [Legionellales bacterium]|jgi:hypothetical protein
MKIIDKIKEWLNVRNCIKCGKPFIFNQNKYLYYVRPDEYCGFCISKITSHPATNKIIIESNNNGELTININGVILTTESARLQLIRFKGDWVQTAVKIFNAADNIQSISPNSDNNNIKININCEAENICWCKLGHKYIAEENNNHEIDNQPENIPAPANKNNK